MRLTFQLRFHTQPGQTLWLRGSDQIFRSAATENGLVPLHFVNDQIWETIIELPAQAGTGKLREYNYVLREANGSLSEDWGKDRVLDLGKAPEEEVLVIDSWNLPGFYENAFYTEPFQQVLLKDNQTEFRNEPPAGRTHIFTVKAPLLAQGQTLCLVGSVPELANWDTTQPILLNRVPGTAWLTIEIELISAGQAIAYKYGVYDLERKMFVRYEDGNNRILTDITRHGKVTFVNDGFAVLPSNTWKGAGVSVPVFSLRSEKSFGVGEFTDLEPLVDWCRQTGLKLIQVLPVNDTTATNTWTDSYPYSAISAFALHPMYLNLEKIAQGAAKEHLASLEEERKRLNGLEAMDYEAVLAAKIGFLNRVYLDQKTKTFAKRDYVRFFQQNRDWLEPYAVFSYLRDEYGTADFTEWPACGQYNPIEVSTLAAESSEAYDKIAFHYFTQYHLHRQLAEAVAYAHARGVVLKGDIPIGVYRYGADAWQAPELYCMEMQAGAPPDAFSAKGQNWGFPTYNWPRMKANGFAWWKRRFEQMGRYFDAFRIDHILGFFRIWSVPVDAVEGILGHFVPALPVRAEEFINRGIPFRRDRFLQPYITDAVLSGLFGQDAEFVKAHFLESTPTGMYALTREFETQRQVESHFASQEQSERNRRLEEGLFDLISNVILFEADEAPGEAFHFRFAIETTSSFQHLDSPTQAKIRDLYIDYFFRRQDEFWRAEALEKLPALKRATNMLVCGEDLGLVPRCVPEVMRQLGLLSLEIQRMPKDLNRQFSRPAEAPYLSVVMPGTHDMNTLRAWWMEDRNVTQRFYNQELGQPGAAPQECEPWIVREIIRQHLASPAMWSIFPLQDLLGLDARLRHPNPSDERINVPANPKNYWRYRMHLSLETVAGAGEFNQQLRQLVSQQGR